MGIKNYIGELQVNGSPVVTEENLEDKVNLTDYVKYTDEPASVMTADGKAGPIKLNETSKCGLYLATQTGKGKYLTVYGPDTTAITRRNGNYPLVISTLDTYLNYAISGKRSYSENGVWKETLGHQIALNNNEKISAHKWLGVPTVLENFDIVYDDRYSERWDVAIRGYNGVMYLASPVPYPPEALINSTLAYKNSSSITDTRPITESMIVHKNENGYTIQFNEAYMFVAYNDQYIPDISNSNCYSPKAGVYFIYYDNGDPCSVEGITNAKRIIVDNDALDLENNEYLSGKIGDIEAALDNKQDELSLDGEYDAETNKIATVQTVVDKIAEIDMGFTSIGTGLSETIKDLLLKLFKRAVYTEDCSEYIKALENEFTIAGDAGGDIGGDGSTAEPIEGYSHIRTIDADSLSIGNMYNTTAPYNRVDTKRAMYAPFDILSGGGRYIVDVEAAEDVGIMVAYHGITEDALAAVKSNASIANKYYDSGWCSPDDEHLIPATYNNSPVVCIRLMFKRSDESDMYIGDIKSVGLFKKNIPVVTIPEGYSLVNTIDESELSVGIGCTSNPPNYSATQLARISYIPFNISITGGTYKVLAKTAEGVSVKVGYRACNEKALAEIASSSKKTTANLYDPGWQDVGIDVNIPETINGSPTACIRFTFKRTDETNVEQGDIEVVYIIKKNTEV